MINECDVLVIGGGPGGSTAASVVARAGHSVTILEAETFPRYTIGESLLLATWSIFRRLGVTRRIASAPFQHKPGATFLWGPTDEPWSIYFAELGGLRASRNVDRGLFDKILLDRSVELGGVLRYGRALGIIDDETGRATGVRTSDGDEYRARFVIDASGRTRPLSRRRFTRIRPDDFKGVAMWTYYKGGHRLEGPDAGNILYAMFTWGWFWVIPLSGDRLSVGVVVNPPAFPQRPPGCERLFEKALKSCPQIMAMIKDAEQIAPLRACGDYSQTATAFHQPGLLLVGDAACFIDPILSTGVHLAMRGGLLAGLALNTVLAGGSEKPAMETFERLYRKEYETLLEVSRQQYDLNSHREERFWQAHRITAPTAVETDKQINRLAFISLVAGITNPDEVLNARIESDREQSKRFGLARFDDPEFGSNRLLPPPTLDPAAGYREGGSRSLRFVRSPLLQGYNGRWRAVQRLDLELFKHIDGKRTVDQVVDAFGARYAMDHDARRYVRRSLGAWLDQGLLGTGHREFSR